MSDLNLTDAQIDEAAWHAALLGCEICEDTGECPDCDGTGKHEDNHDADGNCSQCGGSGMCPVCGGTIVVERQAAS